ncbi:MAG TPA: pyridoxal phosphate-dependent aminotransferase [Thermoplasmata archaeon]|nr:pyridoxal phosphate-dependent aminotransferase [Thermoplasmata archaeon]
MVADRVRRVEISGIRRMFESAPPNSINLGLGEPDFEPSKKVIAALCHAVENGGNHYGPTAGIIPLRERIAARYADRDPRTTRENVIITASGSEGLMSTALAIYDVGDEVLVPNPGFVLYGPHARLAGAVPVPYSLTEPRKFQPDLDELESLVTRRTRAIVVNSPSNPTGGMFSTRTVDRLIRFADAHDLVIVSDEVYDEIVYEGEFTSFWGRTDRAIIVNSFSKTFAVTGWRLGFLVAPPALAVELNKIHYHIMACPPTPAQLAIVAGIDAGHGATQKMVKEFRVRRDLIVRLLQGIRGVSIVPPLGAFYAFPKVDWGQSSTEVATGLLRRGVITTPGDAFGSLGAGHLRLSFANSRERLRAGLEILREYADEVTGG